MLFVLLAHFAPVARATSTIDTDVVALLERVGMLASPAFMLLSGMLLGVLAFGRPGTFGRLRLHLLDRALFTLSVGHLLLMLATGHFASGTRAIFITDAVALAVIVGVIVITRTSASVRLGLAALTYVAGWVLHFTWHPTGRAAQLLAEAVAGPTPGTVLTWSFPVLQWLGVYLVGTVLGEEFVGSRRWGGSLAFCRRLVAFGLVGASAAVAGRLIAVLAGWLPLGSSTATALSELIGLQARLPPGPLYLLLYGGLACALIGVLLELGSRAPVPAWFGAAAVVGRTSLLTFMLQFAIFRSAGLLHVLRSGRPWSVVFAGVTSLVWAAAWAWDHWQGNRLFVVGLEACAAAVGGRPAPFSPWLPRHSGGRWRRRSRATRAS